MTEARCVQCGKRYRLKGDPQAMDFLSLPCPECGGRLEPVEEEGGEPLLEDFLLDRPLALVFWDVPAEKGSFLQALNQLGFESRIIKRPTHLAQWLRFHTPALLILVCEDLGQAKLLFRILDGISLSERRKIFTVWISPKVRTMDPRQALLHSLHLVINTSDLARFPEIYAKARKLWDGFYAPFRQAQEALSPERI